ncbi:MAG: Replication factor C small subunit, partial [Pyrobaculum sp.]
TDAQQALRRIMEIYAQNTRFILLANYVSRIIDPIVSRCAIFRFSPMPRNLMADRLREIAKREGIELKNDAIDVIYELSEGDMRKAINLLQIAAASSKIVDVNVVMSTAAVIKPTDVVELFNSALAGDVLKAREKLRELMYIKGVAGADLIKAFQRELVKIPLEDEIKAEIAEILADVDYRLTQGSDEEIQLMYLIARLGVVGKRAKKRK